MVSYLFLDVTDEKAQRMMLVRLFTYLWKSLKFPIWLK